MFRPLHAVMFLLIATLATQLWAVTLSVVPLGEALKNPALEDTKSEGFEEAFAPIQARMLNSPGNEAEAATFKARTANLAKYRDTRVGKLFFSALAATPAVENLPDTAEFAAVTTTWPLALGSSIRVRVEWSKVDDEWRVSALEVTMDGVAAAPIAGMAPYFGSGMLNASMLDFGPIDYLVGRDPADREKPESERPEFDFDAALEGLFKSEDGAFEAVLKSMKKQIIGQPDRKLRLEALVPHLATPAEAEAATEADADPERRSDFWDGIFAQIENNLAGPRPASVPEGKGSEVRVRYRLAESDERVEGSLAALRLQSGKIAPRGELTRRKEAGDGGESDSSGN